MSSVVVRVFLGAVSVGCSPVHRTIGLHWPPLDRQTASCRTTDHRTKHHDNQSLLVRLWYDVGAAWRIDELPAQRRHVRGYICGWDTAPKHILDWIGEDCRQQSCTEVRQRNIRMSERVAPSHDAHEDTRTVHLSTTNDH